MVRIPLNWLPHYWKWRDYLLYSTHIILILITGMPKSDFERHRFKSELNLDSGMISSVSKVSFKVLLFFQKWLRGLCQRLNKAVNSAFSFQSWYLHGINNTGSFFRCYFVALKMWNVWYLFASWHWKEVLMYAAFPLRFHVYLLPADHQLFYILLSTHIFAKCWGLI